MAKSADKVSKSPAPKKPVAVAAVGKPAASKQVEVKPVEVKLAPAKAAPQQAAPQQKNTVLMASQNKGKDDQALESSAFQFGSNILNPEFLQAQFANHSFVGSDALRQLAENSLSESKAVYDRVKTVLESAKVNMDVSMGEVAKDVAEIQRKSLALFANQMDTVLDLAKSSLTAKSMTDAITNQTAHMRRLMENGVDESKSIATLMQKLAIDSAEQMRAGLTKSMEMTTKLTEQK